MTYAISQRDQREATTINFDVARGEDVRAPAVCRPSIGDLKRLKEDNVFLRFSWKCNCLRPRRKQSGGLPLWPNYGPSRKQQWTMLSVVI